MMKLFVFITLFSFQSQAAQTEAQTEAQSACLECSSSTQSTAKIAVTEPEFGVCPKDAQNALTKAGLGQSLLSAFSGKLKPWDILQNQWADYNRLMNLRVKANAKTINTNSNLKFDGGPYEFIKGLRKLMPMIQAMDELEQKGYLRELLAQPAFRKASQSQDFLETLRDYNFDQAKTPEIKKFLAKPQFRDLVNQVQKTLRDPEGHKYLSLMIENGLSLYDKSSRVDARALHQFIGERNIENQFVRDIPYPRNLAGKVSEAYRQQLQKRVQKYLTENIPTKEELKAVNANISQVDIEGAQKTEAPVEKNFFDEFISPLHAQAQTVELKVGDKSYSADRKKIEAIDAVARTLWGEARGCQKQGLPQYEAIGRIITDRSQAIDRSLIEREVNQKKTQDLVNQFNKGFFGKDQDAALEKLKVKLPAMTKRGLADFGRTNAEGGPSLMDPATQVVTKPLQFSVWNSYLTERKTLLQLNPDKHSNIPDVPLLIQKPQGGGDYNALLSVVCPEKFRDPQLWNQSVETAKLIVLDSKAYQQKYRFDSPEKEILFYTHAAELPFAQEVKVDYLVNLSEKNAKMSLRGSAKDSCGHFRLFVPKIGGSY